MQFKMRQKSLIKILYLVTIFTVLTGIFLSILESNLPVFMILGFSVLYTLVITLIIAFDNKYLLTRMSGLWLTNVQVPNNMNTKLVNDLLHTINVETQKSIDQSNGIALQLQRIKENTQKHYIGALTTKKFHEKHCRFAMQIKEQNRVAFKFETEAKKQGFTKCKCLN